MPLNDLVVLRFAPNSCYTHVDFIGNVKDQRDIAEYPPAKEMYDSLRVDLRGSTWRVDGFENGKIGKGTMQFKGNHCGIIGVYDLSHIDQVNAMLSDSREATRSHCACMDAD